MLELEDQLRRYGEAVETALLRDVPAPRRPAPLVLVAAIVVAAFAAATLLMTADSDPTVSTDSSGVFSTPTGVVLLFPDGIDGATAIDLDRRIGGRRVIRGERAGDQPFRTTLVDNHLVVGWGAIYAAPLDGGASKKIIDATVYIPAAERGEVWAMTWDGGRIDQGGARVRRVRVDGRTTFASDAFDTRRYDAVFGVPGGLVVQRRESPTGVAIWDAATGRVGPVLGTGIAVGLASDGQRLAWCDDPCLRLRISPLPRRGRATAPHVSAYDAVAVSPDGRHVAYLRGGRTPVVRAIESGDESVVAADIPSGGGSMAWSHDSTQLFVAFGGDDPVLGRYRVEAGEWEVAALPELGLLRPSPLALRPEESRSFFAEPGDAAACPPTGNSYPSGRQGVCSFRF